MKTRMALAVSFMVLGAIALWATEGEELNRLGKLGSGNAMAPPGEFSTVSIINETGSRAAYLGWFAETTDQIAKGDGVLFISDVNGNGRVSARVSRNGHGEILLADPGGSVTTVLSAEHGLMSSHGDLAEQFPSDGSQIAPGSVVVLDSEESRSAHAVHVSL